MTFWISQGEVAIHLTGEVDKICKISMSNFLKI